MAFKTRPSVYRIDIARTSRARCRGPCKQTICKVDLRIAITAFVRPNRSTLLARCCRSSTRVLRAPCWLCTARPTACPPRKACRKRVPLSRAQQKVCRLGTGCTARVGPTAHARNHPPRASFRRGPCPTTAWQAER
eukprot:scaffold61222_cov71-Phaeocystis_antarctica.AAC.4